MNIMSKFWIKFWSFFPVLFYTFIAGCWVINLIKFTECDFDSPYREEIIHGIGVITGPGSVITVWF